MDMLDTGFGGRQSMPGESFIYGALARAVTELCGVNG